mmetsp:Transcript_20484/g.40985  ORF Transcript_20484/g.40985 Transcript_20484/m.40985 type:complete len:245 (-) Transcript_20484:45-779(-)
MSEASSPGAPTPLPPATIEYKYLTDHSPTGVYLLPSPSVEGSFTGVIFLRRGQYQNAIFKFTVVLPPGYNAAGTFPSVTFSRPLPFNPMVDPQSGVLDVEGGFGLWNEGEMKDKSFLVTLLTYIKKIFYVRSFSTVPGSGTPGGGAEAATSTLLGSNSIDRPSWHNGEAASLFEQDRKEYDRRVVACVALSQQGMYEPVVSPDGTSEFSWFSRTGEGLKEKLTEGMTAEQILGVVREASAANAE